MAQSSSLCVSCAMGAKGEGSGEEGLGAVSPFTRAMLTHLKEKTQAKHEQSLHGSKASGHSAGRQEPRPKKEWAHHAKVDRMATGTPRKDSHLLIRLYIRQALSTANH